MKALVSDGVELVRYSRNSGVVSGRTAIVRVFTPANVAVGADPEDDILVTFTLASAVQWVYRYRMGYSLAAALELDHQLLRIAPAGADGLTGGRKFNRVVRSRCIGKELA